MSGANSRQTGGSPYDTSIANSIFGSSYARRQSLRKLLRLATAGRRGAPNEPDPRLARRRALYVIAAILIAVSVWIQFPLLLVCGLLVLGITVVPEIWYRFGLRGLTVSHEIESSRVHFGDVVTVPLTLENRSLLPLPMVESTDGFPEALPVLGLRLSHSTRTGIASLTRTLRLWTYQRVRRRYYLRATQRGAFTFGPTVISITDPFGVLTREQLFDTSRALLVHPLVAPLERFGLEPRAIFGEYESRVRLLEDPLRIAGVREYVPGDDPRRVHWKATARLGTLQSKVLDPSTQRTVIIALDVRTFNRAQLGWDPDLAEYGIAVAASVAAWAARHGYAVGLIANGVFSSVNPDAEGRTERPFATVRSSDVPRLRLAPSARPEQLTRILDSLARLIMFGGAPMGPLLASEMRSAPSGASIVYVGLESLVDATTLIALRRAKLHGHGVSLVLTSRDIGDPLGDADTSHDLHVIGFPVYHVGGRERWRALLAETLHDLPTRMAVDTLTEAQLTAERELIKQKRQERLEHKRMTTVNEHTHVPEPQQRSADVEQTPTLAQP